MPNKLKAIEQRLIDYDKHKNEPFAYYHGEIKAVRELIEHAPEDIRFLLCELLLRKNAK